MTGHCGKRDLPDHPHLGHLRRQAKARLDLMQATAAGTQLAEAQLALARDYGFASWRALVAEAMRRRTLHSETRKSTEPGSGQRLWLARRRQLDFDGDCEIHDGFVGVAAAMHIGLVFAALAAVSLLLSHDSRNRFVPLVFPQQHAQDRSHD